MLATVALPSILHQTCSEFEWVVINDGADPDTCDLIAQSQLPCSVRYLEMTHPKTGFGLCHARNLGLAAATSDLVVYLDDDNKIAPEFVAATQQFFERQPAPKCSMVQQRRRRDRVEGERLVKVGVPFLSPTADATVEDLVSQRELFDSNGFVQQRRDAPCWNPSYRVFADYEYFLQCLSLWGADSFRLQPTVLVDYVQRSDGIIGQSSYQDWAIELEQILAQAEAYSAMNDTAIRQLQMQLSRWQAAASRGKVIAAFGR